MGNLHIFGFGNLQKKTNLLMKLRNDCDRKGTPHKISIFCPPKKTRSSIEIPNLPKNPARGFRTPPSFLKAFHTDNPKCAPAPPPWQQVRAGWTGRGRPQGWLGRPGCPGCRSFHTPNPPCPPTGFWQPLTRGGPHTGVMWARGGSEAPKALRRSAHAMG